MTNEVGSLENLDPRIALFAEARNHFKEIATQKDVTLDRLKEYHKGLLALQEAVERGVK